MAISSPSLELFNSITKYPKWKIFPTFECLLFHLSYSFLMPSDIKDLYFNRFLNTLQSGNAS